MQTDESHARGVLICVRSVSRHLKKQSWTAWQVRWILIQLSVLASLLLALIVVHFNDTSLLWTTRIGFNMLCQMIVLLAIGFGIALIACALMDRVYANWYESKPMWGKLTAVLLLGVQFVWLLLPAVFVLVNGPAAVAIAETLAMP